MRMARSNVSMRLFGVPYQYNSTTDPRIDDINPQIGKQFLETVMSEPPILTLIPGKPKYLPGSGKDAREIAGYLMLDASDKGDGSRFHDFLTSASDIKNKTNLRLYDFERAYTEYISYVNLLCRTGAAFLGLSDTISIGGNNVQLTKFDWSRYHLTSSDSGGVGSGLVKWVINRGRGDGKFDFYGNNGGTEGNITDAFSSSKYVQFYVDPESSSGSDGISNSTSESQLKSLFDNASGWAKELAFLANSGGISSSKFGKFVEGSASSLNSFVNKTLGETKTGSGAIARILNIGGNVLKGDNIIIPEFRT